MVNKYIEECKGTYVDITIQKWFRLIAVAPIIFHREDNGIDTHVLVPIIMKNSYNFTLKTVQE